MSITTMRSAPLRLRKAMTRGSNTLEGSARSKAAPTPGVEANMRARASIWRPTTFSSFELATFTLTAAITTRPTASMAITARTTLPLRETRRNPPASRRQIAERAGRRPSPKIGGWRDRATMEAMRKTPSRSKLPPPGAHSPGSIRSPRCGSPARA